MPKALIFVTLLVLVLGVWLVIGQKADFERFGNQRERKVARGAGTSAESRREVELHGRFLDAAGRPLVGLTVELAAPGVGAEERTFAVVDRSLTDDKGRFSFRVESPSPRLIRVLMPDGAYRRFVDLPPSTALELQLDP